MIKISSRQVWECSDGKTFFDKDDARKYEFELKINELIDDYGGYSEERAAIKGFLEQKYERLKELFDEQV